MNECGSERVLVIKAKGGFGNRILSAVTGVVIAEITGRTPVIDWRDGMYLPTDVNAYPLLFENPVRLEPAEFDHCREVAPRIWSGRLAQHPVDLVEEFFPSKHSSPFVYRRLSIDLADPTVPEDVAVFWSYVPKMARIRRLCRRSDQFRGHSDDEITLGVLRRYFRPNSHITHAVDRIADRWSGPAIGVHVRYTDRKVPLHRIVSALSDLRHSQPDAPVFLATDSEEVQDLIMERFEGVVTIEKEFATGSASLHDDATFDDPIREAENALIDLWTLSRCTWLIHSRNSTFSVAASLIGGVPMERQFDVERHDPRLVMKRLIQARA